MECVEDDFLTQLLKESIRGASPLFMNREGMMGDMVRRPFGYSDHKVIGSHFLVKSGGRPAKPWTSGG